MAAMQTPDIARTATVHWEGDIARGKGKIDAESGTVSANYSFNTRFSNEPGTNPEELLAPPTASCFTMALTLGLSRAGHAPSSVDTSARVHLRRVGEGFDIALIELSTKVSAPGIDDAASRRSRPAQRECPISKALRTVETHLDAKLNT